MIALLAIALSAQPVPSTAPDSCVRNRDELLALGQQAFDQDLQGGWRAVSARHGCEIAAADLIRDYRAARGLTDTILFWHEGQLRAAAGQTDAAIRLFEQSRKPPSDRFGWNPYVDATIAFLRGDRAALIAAREALAALPRPADFEPRDPQGRPLQISWPMNLQVVDGLIACFGRSYKQAYARNCTAASPPPRN